MIGFAILNRARVNATRVGYISAALAAKRATSLTILLAGAPAQVRLGSLRLHDALNDAPNTCTLAIESPVPQVAQTLRVTLGADTPRLLFAGVLQTVAVTYEGLPSHALYACTAVDDAARLERLRPLGTWANVSATTVVTELLAAFAPGFAATGVQAGLPAISIILDGTEGFSSALTQIARLIGGAWYAEDGVLYVFTGAAALPPYLVDTSHPFLNEPPITSDTDLSQVRTRVYGRGHAESTPGEVAAGETILPITDAVMFNAFGGKALAATQRLAYTGKQLGGAGSLVGPGAMPGSAPAGTVAAGAGLGTGQYGYAYTYVTATGETLPGPLLSLAVAAAPTTTVAARTPPSASTLTLEALGGPPDFPPYGAWTVKLTFTYADGSESLPSAASNSVTTTGNYDRIHVSLPLGPSGVTGRKIYFNGPSTGGAWKLGAYGTIANNTATTSNQPAQPMPGSAVPPTVVADYTSAATVLYVTNAALFAVSGTAYASGQAFPYTGRSAASGVAALTGVSGIGATIVVGATISNAPVGGNQVALTAVAIGPTGTTTRKVYRTVVGGAALKLLTTLADNATTTYLDAIADGALGAAAPASDTSGLAQPTGQVLAGAATLLVAAAAPFLAGGGWALVGAQAVRYTGVSGNTLTGLPASGPGALLSTVRYGEHVDPTPALTGVTGLAVALAKGTAVAIWVERNDLAAQAELAALDGSNGVYEYVVADDRRGEVSLVALCDANLALYGRPARTVRFATRTYIRSGTEVQVSLVSPPIVATLVAQTVDVDEIGTAPRTMPRFTVVASSLTVSLDSLLRDLLKES